MKEVPKIEYVEKIIEVPQIQTVEKIVEVPQVQVQERIIHKPVTIVQEREVQIPKIEYVERIVEVPHVQQRPVEQIVQVDGEGVEADAAWEGGRGGAVAVCAYWQW